MNGVKVLKFDGHDGSFEYLIEPYGLYVYIVSNPKINILRIQQGGGSTDAFINVYRSNDIENVIAASEYLIMNIMEGENDLLDFTNFVQAFELYKKTGIWE